MTDGQEEEQIYRLLDPAEFEGAYTPEEVELNRRLCEACCREELDAALVEELLRQGADHWARWIRRDGTCWNTYMSA